MQTIVVHDARLAGDTPTGNRITPIRVDATTPLASMVSQVRNASTRHGTDVKLNVLCHGFAEHGELGYGLQLCRERLTLTTVQSLQPLNGMISYGIDIYACGAAHTATWRTGEHGDGWTLCSRVASITQSVLRAADLTQWYNYFGGIAGLFRQEINFGQWEGRVVTFNSRGQEIGAETDPAR